MTLNRPNPRLQSLRAQLAAKAEAEQLQRDTMRLMSLAPIRCKAPAPDAATLPLPPSYDADFAAWADCLTGKSNSEQAAFEEWLNAKRPSGDVTSVQEQWLDSAAYDEWFAEHLGARGTTLAPAKPAAKQTEPPAAKQVASVWRLGSDVPASERVGLWHIWCSKLEDNPGPACSGFTFSSVVGLYRPAAPGAKLGDPYDESKYAATDLTARLASTSSADGAALIGFDRSADPGVAKLTHSVCIRAHGFADWKVGDISENVPSYMAHPDNWRACDESGWVTHTPTADSTCPVPVGVRYQAKIEDGRIGLFGYWPLHSPGNSIIAWRPIADGSK